MGPNKMCRISEMHMFVVWFLDVAEKLSLSSLILVFLLFSREKFSNSNGTNLHLSHPKGKKKFSCHFLGIFTFFCFSAIFLVLIFHIPKWSIVLTPFRFLYEQFDISFTRKKSQFFGASSISIHPWNIFKIFDRVAVTVFWFQLLEWEKCLA